MIDHHPSSDTYNARWIVPEAVAETFVPIPQFRQLVHNSHSLLLGPRGCGKTTLLKMLTRPAQQKWKSSGRASLFGQKFSEPPFEAIYIPSDVRWSFEVRGIPDSIKANNELVQRTQRVMVAINAIYHFLGTIGDLIGDDRYTEKAICEQLIRRLSLTNTLPTIHDTRSSLDELAAGIRGSVSRADPAFLEQVLNEIPRFLYGHALDPMVNVIRFVSDYLKVGVRPARWALCYDELEIAPDWLRQELVAGLRSGPQEVLLKLTWFPILPSGIPTSPNLTDDFRAIRLWHSHVEDPKVFCEELTTEFLRRKFGSSAPTPAQFFNRSVLASEADDEPTKAYERDSTEYESFVELAQWDKSFVKVLKDRCIDPNDPVPKNQKERDEFFRKIKPIVLLRNEFADAIKKRSRKAPALYVGREAIYAMSEGNPRWLLSLLTDLADLGASRKGARHSLFISYASQGKILTSAAFRLRALIKSSPFTPPESVVRGADHTLLEFVEILGRFFQESIHDRSIFRIDPIGSFVFPKESDGLYSSMVSQLLEIGALVYVGTSVQDVPSTINDARFRLSFMLAPVFRLPFRNFGSIPLREILLDETDKSQLNLAI